MTSSQSGPVVLDRSSPLPLSAQLLEDLRRRLREADCRLLAMAKGAPGLSLDRLTRYAQKRPFEWRRSLMRGDRYVLVAESG